MFEIKKKLLLCLKLKRNYVQIEIRLRNVPKRRKVHLQKSKKYKFEINLPVLAGDSSFAPLLSTASIAFGFGLDTGC